MFEHPDPLELARDPQREHVPSDAQAIKEELIERLQEHAKEEIDVDIKSDVEKEIAAKSEAFGPSD